MTPTATERLQQSDYHQQRSLNIRNVAQTH